MLRRRALAARRSVLLPVGARSSSATNEGDVFWPAPPRNAPRPKRAKKRTLALVLGYCGTNFTGLQLQRHHDRPTVTIESTLLEALFRRGLVSANALTDLGTVNWSRASRTDKGVHAVQTVVSGHFNIRDEATELVDGRLRQDLVDGLNAELDGTGIKVWAVTRMPKSFCAKTAASWREYEYLLPLSVLTHPSRDGAFTPSSEEEVLGRFQAALQRLEGTHSFHNFTLAKFFRSKDKPRHCGRQAEEDDEAGVEEGEEEEERREEHGGEAETEQSDELQVQETVRTFSAQMDDPSIVSARIGGGFLRDQAAHTRIARRTISRCEMLPERVVVDDEEFVVLRVRGQSFVLHQIRFIVGAALAVARDVLPPWVLDAAVRSSWMFKLPLGSEVGLMKNDAGFGRVNSVSVALTPARLGDEQLPPGRGVSPAVPLPRFRVRQPFHMSQHRGGFQVLMSDEATQAAADWKKKFLYPTIADLWRAEVAVPDGEPADDGTEPPTRTMTRAQELTEFVDGFRWSNQQSLGELHDRWQEVEQQLDADQAALDRKREAHRRRALEEVREFIDQRGVGLERGPRRPPVVVPNKLVNAVLPNHFATDLAIHLRTPVGMRVKALTHIVAQETIKGNIGIDTTTPDIFEWLHRHGLLEDGSEAQAK